MTLSLWGALYIFIFNVLFHNAVIQTENPKEMFLYNSMHAPSGFCNTNKGYQQRNR